MARRNGKILIAEQEQELRQPIKDHVDKVQEKIDSLRADGTNRAVVLQSSIDVLKRDRSVPKEEKENRIAEYKARLDKAKAAGAENKDEVSKLIVDAITYLEAHLDKDYYQPPKESCEQEKALAKGTYSQKVAELGKEHKNNLSKITDCQEIKDEEYVHKNRMFNVKMDLEKQLQQIRDRRHAVFAQQYYLIDLLRLSEPTFMEPQQQKLENYLYSFNCRTFLLDNGLYIAIILIFIGLCITAPVIEGVPLFMHNNILQTPQQVSPRMSLVLGAMGLIPLADTDPSISRMVGMGTTIVTIIMRQGINTGMVFGHAFDFTGMPLGLRMASTLFMCTVLCTYFTAIAGFFTTRFKIHPFISTMANMLVIFGPITYVTKGVSFGAIGPAIPKMIVPRLSGLPAVILWAVAVILIIWFIWSKTTFGKNLYAVGGDPEAASVSGISVFGVTMGAFTLAGVLYGFGSWLECARMVGSGFAAYGQGWETDVIAICITDGVSFTGGIGKVSSAVIGALIFTILVYSLTALEIDTNPQFVFGGIIIVTVITLDCLKYVQRR